MAPTRSSGSTAPSTERPRCRTTYGCRHRHPPAFTPTLASQARRAFAYVGVADLGRQLRGLDKLDSDVFGEQDSAAIEDLIKSVYRMTDAQLATVLEGEQAWWYGSSLGAAFRA